MSDEVTFEPLAGGEQPGEPVGDLGRLRDVPVDLAVEIGRARMTVGQTLELRPGSIVMLDRVSGEPVDLLVNGTRVAHGEVVVIDETFALRVTEIVGETQGAVREPEGAPEPEPAIEQAA
jgi:flagellar motor switch protein FliN